MALVVDTNSYVSVANANTYFADSLRIADWAAISPALQAAALIDATRYLQRLKWKGEKTSSAQALAWPRTGVTDLEGSEVDDATVPTEIKEAQIELALKLSSDPSALDSINDQSGTNIRRVKADEVEVEFFRPSYGSQLYPWIQSLVGIFLESSTLLGTGIGGIVGGNEDLSSFTDAGLYGRTGGFA